MNADRWQRILRIVNETFENYETGMAVLRKRAVANMKRKLVERRLVTKRTGRRSG